MQFKTLLVAFGLAAATTGATLPEAQLKARSVTSAPFKIRRFTPLANFNPATVGTWSNNQYTDIYSVNKVFNYNGVSSETAYLWTLSTDGVLKGSTSGNGGLTPKSVQSYDITVTPVTFGGVGENVIVTIGPAPLNEVEFQTVRNGSPVGQWTSFSQIGGLIFLGKTADIDAPVRFRAIDYTALV